MFAFFKSKPQENNDIHKEILREKIRQAHLSFNLALAITATSAIFILAGVGLLYLDKIGEASLTTSSGIVASIRSTQFAKKKNEELQTMLEIYQKQ